MILYVPIANYKIKVEIQHDTKGDYRMEILSIKNKHDVDCILPKKLMLTVERELAILFELNGFRV